MCQKRFAKLGKPLLGSSLKLESREKGTSITSNVRKESAKTQSVYACRCGIKFGDGRDGAVVEGDIRALSRGQFTRSRQCEETSPNTRGSASRVKICIT